MQTVKGIKLTDGQAEVYKVMRSFGRALPDHVLVPLYQHAAALRQASSGIRSRRHELLELGLVREDKLTRTASGRAAKTFKAVR